MCTHNYRQIQESSVDQVRQNNADRKEPRTQGANESRYTRFPRISNESIPVYGYKKIRHHGHVNWYVLNRR